MADEKNKFDRRINEIYAEMVQPSVMKDNEPETEEEEEITLTPTQMAAAKKKVKKDSILGFNVGKSAKIKKELDRKTKLEDEYDNGPAMDDIVNKLQKSNDNLEAELSELGY